jgi:Fur family ferric uptake transcriptional regulator
MMQPIEQVGKSKKNPREDKQLKQRPRSKNSDGAFGLESSVPGGPAGTSTRMTKQRATILAELRYLNSHPTADEIYGLVRQKLPRISLGTVYRNLELLTETREILKLEYAGFQKRFDGNIHDHQHVRCIICGKVADVENLAETPALPEDARVPGFTVLSARVEFFGICKDCA